MNALSSAVRRQQGPRGPRARLRGRPHRRHARSSRHARGSRARTRDGRRLQVCASSPPSPTSPRTRGAPSTSCPAGCRTPPRCFARPAEKTSSCHGSASWWERTRTTPRSGAPEREAEFRRLAADPLTCAVGEMGLDYHYDHSPRDVQRDRFAHASGAGARVRPAGGRAPARGARRRAGHPARARRPVGRMHPALLQPRARGDGALPRVGLPRELRRTRHLQEGRGGPRRCSRGARRPTAHRDRLSVHGSGTVPGPEERARVRGVHGRRMLASARAEDPAEFALAGPLRRGLFDCWTASAHERLVSASCASQAAPGATATRTACSMRLPRASQRRAAIPCRLVAADAGIAPCRGCHRCSKDGHGAWYATGWTTCIRCSTPPTR